MARLGAGIPERYKKYWIPYRTAKLLVHVTTVRNYSRMQKTGKIEPRDPSPQQWAGMKAVFLSDPQGSLYRRSVRKLLAHIKADRQKLVRLYIRTTNNLYKCNSPGRTFHRMSLNPISTKDIRQVEEIPE